MPARKNGTPGKRRTFAFVALNRLIEPLPRNRNPEDGLYPQVGPGDLKNSEWQAQAFWVTFAVSKEAIHGPAKHNVGLLKIRDASGSISNRLHCRPVQSRLGLASVTAVSVSFSKAAAPNYLHRGDKIGNEIVSPLILRFDVGPLCIHPLLKRDKPVVAAHGTETNKGQHGENNSDDVFHDSNVVDAGQ